MGRGVINRVSSHPLSGVGNFEARNKIVLEVVLGKNFLNGLIILVFVLL